MSRQRDGWAFRGFQPPHGRACLRLLQNQRTVVEPRRPLHPGRSRGQRVLHVNHGRPDHRERSVPSVGTAVPHAHEYLAGEQLEILPYKQWYCRRQALTHKFAWTCWVGKARHTEKKGPDGIRITGNPVWLRSAEDWTKFGHYERTVQNRIKNERVIALCTYPVDPLHRRQPARYLDRTVRR